MHGEAILRAVPLASPESPHRVPQLTRGQPGPEGGLRDAGLQETGVSIASASLTMAYPRRMQAKAKNGNLQH